MAGDQLAGIPDLAPTAPSEGGQVLAELWRNIWPWDDLNAKGPPERWLKLGQDVLPVLAALVAQTPIGPKLLTADRNGALVVNQSYGEILGFLDMPTNVSPSVLRVTRPLQFPVLQVTLDSASIVIDLQVVGDQTHTVYFHVTGTSPAPLQGPFWVYVTDPRDVTFTVSMQVGALASGVIFVSARTDIPRQQVKSAAINFTLNGGQSVTLVPAISGFQVYLIGLFIATPGAVNALINIEDDVPNILSEVYTNVTYAAYRELHGIAGAAGHLVRARNTAGGAAAATVGELLYVQASPNLAPGLGLPG